MPIEQPELKSCPFCGNPGPLMESIPGEDGRKTVLVWIHCPGCEAETAGHMDSNRAIAAWNHRADPH